MKITLKHLWVPIKDQLLVVLQGLGAADTALRHRLNLVIMKPSGRGGGCCCNSQLTLSFICYMIVTVHGGRNQKLLIETREGLTGPFIWLKGGPGGSKLIKASSKLAIYCNTTYQFYSYIGARAKILTSCRKLLSQYPPY